MRYVVLWSSVDTFDILPPVATIEPAEAQDNIEPPVELAENNIELPVMEAENNIELPVMVAVRWSPLWHKITLICPLR